VSKVQNIALEWQQEAACKGPLHAVFFPPSQLEPRDEKARREARAKSICKNCPVTEPCLDYAIRIREAHGVWGGTTEVERRIMLTRIS
jgi:WhiB family transcriptional regulator, redox-sensing transcriptional regulator